nr:ABC transporter permease [Pseudomonas folii]
MPLYFAGLLTTLELLGMALAFGLLAALPLGLMRVSRKPWVNLPAWLYTYVIRGTPMLVQLYLIYYGLSQFAAVRESFLWPWLSSATFCACLAFAINTSAYTAEIIAGSLKATPAGEIEAARAMGMSKSKMYRRILLPSALRRALPQYSNEVIMMLQTTSLASSVTLVDITGAARAVNSESFLPFEAFITAGVFYLCLTFILVRLFKLAERRWLGYLAPRKA